MHFDFTLYINVLIKTKRVPATGSCQRELLRSSGGGGVGGRGRSFGLVSSSVAGTPLTGQINYLARTYIIV